MTPMRRLCRWLLRGAWPVLAVAATLAAVPAQAVTGADAPEFRAALAMWLHDEEGPALSAMAELAQAGNPAAQILLGLIDKSPALQGPWLARLPRGERLALLRAQGGRSGQSWLRVAEDEPVASAWLELMRVEAGPEVAARLAALGEARAAREALIVLAAREHPEFPQAWTSGADPETAYLFWARADEAQRIDITARVPEGHPQWSLMGTPPADPAAAWSGWLADSPAALPLRVLCDLECPASAADCRMAAYAALGSHNALLTLGSPAESLISQEEFLASARGRAAVLRRILLAVDVRGRNALMARTRSADACMGERLEAENTRYRYIRG